MKNKFLIFVTGSKSMLATGFVSMLNGLGHTAMEAGLPELQSFSFLPVDQPQLIFIASFKKKRDEIETIELLKQSYPDAPVIGIIIHEEFNNIIRGIKAGIHGYVLASIEPQQLDKAVRIVAVSRPEIGLHKKVNLWTSNNKL